MASLAAIFCLLFLGGPTAIFRRVVSIVVNSVNRMFWARAKPHIINEVDIGIPSFANLNASSAISMKSNCVWIIAPRPHRNPRMISGFFYTLATCVPMCRDDITMQASAGTMSV